MKSYHAFADLMFGTVTLGRHTSKHLEQASSQLIDARHSRRLSTPTEFVSPNPPLPFLSYFFSSLLSPAYPLPHSAPVIFLFSFFPFLFSFHHILLFRILPLVPLAAPGEAITIRAPPPCRRTREELAKATCSAEERRFSISIN